MREASFDFWSDAGSPEFEIAPGHLSRRTRAESKHDRMLDVLKVGRNVCFGGGKGGGGSSPAPDPQIGQAALKNAQIGEDWLKFAREQFDVGNERQEDMDALTESVIDQQLATQEQQSQWALEDRTRYKEKFQPLQDEFIETAKNYDSPERQAQVAAEAKADVMKAAGQQQLTNQRQMASMGLNPASGRFQGQSRADNMNTALSSAGAQNTARQGVRDKALALKADAINIGSGLPSQSAAAASLGLNAGNSATGNSNQAMGSWRANQSIMGQGFQGAMQGYANQGNMLNNLYGNQLNAWSAQQQANATSAAGIGSAVGTVAGAGIMVF